MVVVLIAKFAIPAVAPFLPSALGYTRHHRPYRQVFTSVRESSEWFGVWQGLIAFCVAWIRHEQETRASIRLEAGRQGLYYPTWIERLLEARFDITWIEGFLCSSVFDFSGLTQRAGIFLDFGPDRDAQQPSPDWFVAYNVPVWFNLKDAQKKYPNAGTAIFPQPHELQLFVSAPPTPGPSLRLSPSPPPPSETTVPTSSLRHEDNHHSQSRGDEMRAFISRREEAIAEMMRTSSEVERQRWAGRRATPKTSKCRVVLWSADPRDPSRLVRELAGDTDILDEYTSAQKWYDPINQTWHCCFDLAPGEVTAEAAELINDYYGQDVLVPVDGVLPDATAPGSDHSLSAQPCLVSSDGALPDVTGDGKDLQLAAQSSTVSSPHHVSHIYVPPILPEDSSPDQFLPSTRQDEQGLADEVLAVLVRYYGFVPPLPMPTDRPTVALPEPQRVWLLRTLGFHPTTSLSSPFFQSPLCHLAVGFLEQFCKKSGRPHPDNFDLDATNRDPLTSSPYLYKWFLVSRDANDQALVPPLYVFQFDETTGPWLLSVTTADDAVLVMRLHRLGLRDLAVHLATAGIRFHTLAPVTLEFPSRSTYLRPPPQALPIRTPGYVFTQRDYDAYLHARALLLADPRMRAAIQRGGILWRLAVSVLSPWDALAGPTGAPGLALVHPRTGHQLIDDALTTEEVQILCGSYICFTGRGSDQFSLKSWWPLPETFDHHDSGENYGRWTSYRENHYQNRLEDIRKGAQPMTNTQWRSFLRGRPDLRRLRHNREASARAFLASNCPASGLTASL
ncbi:hypothetical protein CC1G_14928 [Coprinopsis cinerea okayama7|uniref:Uncharacterized protein n=1 Tax=Coprinopsis cinerea (strain Okayama-7 / 130 / ATCC MYA-4618 / FGSC 9003) TaxID=240176 RepID=D6RPB0_COPC7|nr:hypothetical protein CC1G_14928 [Coprinopsis cinerea okayama7\|eukprot:XP_002910597.1 hypothetical protein CC1G_14928 [Coprinopsis cinerea okayama7\